MMLLELAQFVEVVLVKDLIVEVEKVLCWVEEQMEQLLVEQEWSVVVAEALKGW